MEHHNHKEDQDNDWQLNRAQCGIRNRSSSSTSLKINNQTVSVNARHEVD